MSVLPKMIHRFSEILIKIQIDVFVEIDKPVLKFICKCKGPRITNVILKKKVRALMLLDFKTSKATI